jgi:Mg-chelatase subunit ChlD
MSVNLENLKNRDYYLVLDKSTSMETKDCGTVASPKSRWEAAKELTIGMANRCQEYDPDGITVVPFADKHKFYANTVPSVVEKIFKENFPSGSTNLAPPLQACFDDYLKAKKAGTAKANGAVVVVVTDGQPGDGDDVARAIVAHTKKLDNREEFGISFLQIGQDEGARDFLKRLDSHLSSEGAKLDIVNTKTMDELGDVGLDGALIAALTE